MTEVEQKHKDISVSRASRVASFCPPCATANLRIRMLSGKISRMTTGDAQASTGANSLTNGTRDVADITIGVVGGTGDQGRGLALRFARAGHDVWIGSRDPERAQSLAGSLHSRVRGVTNEEAVTNADVVIIAVPWSAHRDTLVELRPGLSGKIVIDCVNPLGFDAQGAFALDVEEGSALGQASALLPESTVVGAFHHISAVLLLEEDREQIPADVLVLGDDRAATDLVQKLVSRIEGMRGVYGGRIRNAGQVEAFTANLIAINRRYKSHAGLRITDLEID